MHRWTGPGEQKSYTVGSVLVRAVWTATFTSSSTPWFFTAEMGTTGMPNAWDIPFTSMVPPPMASTPEPLVTSSVRFPAFAANRAALSPERPPPAIMTS